MRQRASSILALISSNARGACFFGGLVAMYVGLSEAWHPLGLIVSGAVLAAVSAFGSWRSTRSLS